MFVTDITDKAMPKPVETFLISDGTPYRIDCLDHTVQAIHPRIDFYDVSQPDPKHQNLRIDFPRELVEEILDHLQIAYLKNKEFGDAMMLQTIDRKYQRHMHRRWIDPIRKPCKHPICYARPIAKFFYLAMILFDYAFDASIIDFADPDAAYEDDDFVMNRTGDIPVVTINHPYAFSMDGAIKPHHLVAPRRRRTGSRDWCMQFNPIPYPMLRFEDFEHAPVVAWTGHRVCDCFVIDAVSNNGIYQANKVLHPFLILRLDTQATIGSTEWKAGLAYWKRFAEVVRIAFDGAQLYIVDNHAFCERVQ